MKKINLICILLFAFYNGFAQKNQVLKENSPIKAIVEFETESNTSYVKIPLNYYGFILGYISKKTAVHGLKKFVIKKYDLDLKEEYLTEIDFPAKNNLLECKVEGDFLYFLFTKKDKFTIIQFDYITKKIKNYSNKDDKKLYVKKMTIQDGVVSLVGESIPNKTAHKIAFWLSTPLLFTPMIFYNLKYLPAILNIDMNSERAKISEYPMNNYLKSNVIYEDIKPSKEKDEIRLVLKLWKYGQVEKTTVRTLKNGKLLKDNYLKLPPKVDIYDINLYIGDNNENIIYGNYDNSASMEKSATGFYSCLIDSTGQRYFKIINWTDLINRKQTQLKIKKIFSKKDYKVFFGELCAADFVYISATNSYNFVGYIYSGALIFAINNQGNLLWSHQLEMKTTRAMQEMNKFSIFESEDNLYKIIHQESNELIIETLDFSRKNAITNHEKLNLETGKSVVENSKFMDKETGYTIQNDNSELYEWYDSVLISFDLVNKKNKAGLNINKNFIVIKKIELPN